MWVGGGAPRIQILLNKGHYIEFGQGGREGFKSPCKNYDIIHGCSLRGSINPNWKT